MGWEGVSCGGRYLANIDKYASTDIFVRIYEQGGPKIQFEGFFVSWGDNKMAPTSVIVICYKDIRDFHLIHTSAKHSI